MIWQNIMAELTTFQTDTKESLRSLFPEIEIEMETETEQVRQRDSIRGNVNFYPMLENNLHMIFFYCFFCFLLTQSKWLQVFTQKALEALKQQSLESQSNTAMAVSHSFLISRYASLNLAQQKYLNVFPLFQELLENQREAEDSHGTLQAECDQYRTVLAETVCY